jgi:hypothetical protein
MNTKTLRIHGEPYELKTIPSSEVIDAIISGYNLDIKNANIIGDLDMRKIVASNKKNDLETIINSDINIYDSEIIGNLFFVRFNGNVSFNASVFNCEANFRSSIFAKSVDFDLTIFNSYTDFLSSLFESDANFNQSRFTEGVRFKLCRFNGKTNFSSAVFGNRPIDQPTINSVYLDSVEFNGTASFDSAKFNIKAFFNTAIFHEDASFRSTIFRNSVNFKATIFGGNLYFVDVNICDNLDVLDRRIDLSFATFKKNVVFNNFSFGLCFVR